MEFQGTKGKWKIGIASKGRTKNIDIKTDNSLIIIEDEFGKVIGLLGRIGIIETESNAKLIESAPEMFEMLKEAKSTIQSLRLSMSAHPDYEVDSEFYDYVDLADEKETKIEKLLTKITEQ